MQKFNCFVCHHPALKERREYFEKRLSLVGIEHRIMDLFSPYEAADTVNAKKLITDAEASLYIKHRWIFEYAAVSDKWTVIMEDDCEIDPNFEAVITDCLSFLGYDNYTKNPCSMIWLGVCCDLHARRRNAGAGNGFLAYENDNGSPLTTRCTHCYMLNKFAAQRIISSPLLRLYDKPIDHKLNDIILEQNLHVAWYEPGIPQCKQFKSSLR